MSTIDEEQANSENVLVEKTNKGHGRHGSEHSKHMPEQQHEKTGPSMLNQAPTPGAVHEKAAPPLTPKSTTEQSTAQQQEIEQLQRQLAEAREKAEDNWDKFLRVNAEIDNIRRRGHQELEKANKYANERFAKELLDVLDSLEKGLEATAKVQSEEVANIYKGMELTHKLLVITMEKYGIHMIDPQGEPFDPIKHEALTMQPSNEVAPNHVLLVVQKGYTIHERILRPARVIVAKAAD